jgi:hypothetical protein
MPGRLLAIVLLAVATTITACGGPSPTSTPVAPVSDAPGPTDVAAPSPEPSAPGPATSPDPPTSGLTPDEAFLIAGIRHGTTGCLQVRDRLPPMALAGIECASDDVRVARVALYRFASEADLLAVYVGRMDEEGVARDSGSCVAGEAEAAYTPGEGFIPLRSGCFLHPDGFATFMATLDGQVLLEVDGRTPELQDVEAFAWERNEDAPGSPTIWRSPGT